jgi:hypothetical protein
MARLLWLNTIMATALTGLILSLPMLLVSVSAQSGRKGPPTAKPSPSPTKQEGTSSDQDEQTTNSGNLSGEGETIKATHSPSIRTWSRCR